MAYCPKCGENAGNNAFCSHCGTKINTEISRNASVADPYFPDSTLKSDPVVQPEFPMKWHKFMIYFALWANAVINIINGLVFFSLTTSSPIAGILGLIFLGIAVWAIYVRFQLAGLRTGAPKKLLIWMIVSVAMGLLSAIGNGDSQAIPAVIGNISYTVWNWRYYSSREELFVN